MKAEAVAVAVRVAEEFPQSALSYALLGSAYYNTGQSEEAARHLRRCLELDPRQVDAYEILARAAYEKGELEECIELCQQGLKLAPNRADLLNQLGKSLMDRGQTEESRQMLLKAVQAARPTSESYYLLGQANLQMGDYAAAKESFLRATRLVPDHTQAFFGLYTACSRLGETEEATKYRDEFLKLEAIDRRSLTDRSAQQDTLSGLPLVRQTVARTLFGAAQIYQHHGKGDDATALFYRAAILDADSPIYRASLEAIYLKSDRLADGVNAFQQLTTQQPSNSLNYYFLGRLQERLNRLEDAERAYQRVRELSPGWTEGHRVLAELYLRTQRNLPAAVGLARRLVELEPTASNYYLLAVACSVNKERDAGIEAIRHAIALDPNESRYVSLLEQLETRP